MMMAFAPAENLVAVADAPPTIDAALQAAYDSAAIYFPFTDVIVADPYKDIADGLKVAFYIGQSNVVGGTTTDMVAYVTGDVFVQAWIGAEDKLPRRVYAVYLNDRARLRHVLELSNWQLDGAVPAGRLRVGQGRRRDAHRVCAPGREGRARDEAAAEGQAPRPRPPRRNEEPIMKKTRHHVWRVCWCRCSRRVLPPRGRTPILMAAARRTREGSGSTTRTDAAGGSETHTYGQGTTATAAYGGTATHKEGSGQTTATRRYGGTATHTAGQGTTATGAYGGSAYHAEGSGYTTYTGANGATAYHSPYYGAAYPAYHPPTTVNYYGAGCYNCGGWNAAGAAAAGAVGRHGGGRGGGLGQHRGRDVECLCGGRRGRQRQHRERRTTRASRPAHRGDAPAVAGAAGASGRRRRQRATFAMGGVYATLPAGVHIDQQERHHVLPERQYLVPAGLRRERRLLPRRADALTSQAIKLCNRRVGA